VQVNARKQFILFGVVVWYVWKCFFKSMKIF